MSYNNEPNFCIKEMAEYLPFTSQLEKQFFTRIFSTPKSVYDERIKQIDFTDKKLVLDAGCGYGQWTMSLNDLNKEVYAIDFDSTKLKIAKSLLTKNKKFPKFQHGSLENLPFKDESFDAIFSYSVLYWTNYEKSLKEFFRILKPSGTVYFVTNGIGWSLYNLFSGHSSANDFNARIHALKTIFSTIKYSITKKRDVGQSHYMSKKWVNNFMKEIGFKSVIIKDEGYLNNHENITLHPFYKKKFFGTTNVFEVLAQK
jgi:ubiquinone/menaquinone biosynthesis C-methylase UbiE